MARELFQFAVVMVVVMLGFAMAFYALVRETDDVFGETYGETWLKVFQAMLGEVSIFDEVIDNDCQSSTDDDCNPYSPWITVLLVIYLIITSIMLLNLLVAVLTVQHQTVQENVDKEIKVSKALIFEYYECVVKNDTLPAPLNILQLAVSLPIWAIAPLLESCLPIDLNVMYSAAKIAVGKAVFWLAMSTIVVVGGSLLWVCSLPLAVFVVCSHVWKGKEGDMHFGRDAARVGGEAAMWTFGTVLLCTILAPLFLLVSWLRGIFRGVMRSCRQGGMDSAETGKDDPKAIIQNWLGPLSVPLLREYLENPMSDPTVRQDERTRQTTVEHVKLLRDRLEQHIVQTVNANTVEHVKRLRDRLEQHIVQTVKANTDAAVAQAMDRVTEAIKEANVRMDKLQSALETLVNGSQQARAPAKADLEDE